MKLLSARDYRCGWICALSSELAAAKAMLDEQHKMIVGKDPQDSNAYILGRIHDHNVVMTCLPAGVDGTNAAATAAINMIRTFTAVRFGFMVGIGGGIPDLENGLDIRLGDVVVSQPEGHHGGVVQYDKGKSLTGRAFQMKGSLNSPPRVLLTALQTLQAEHLLEDPLLAEYVDDALNKHPRMAQSGYRFPGWEQDLLHCDRCVRPRESCKMCRSGLVKRTKRTSLIPSIHYGTIASGNKVIKNVTDRCEIKHLTQAKCIEMEAAGLMNKFPCLVIRGICDYADSFKNDTWHNYAAITAAAYTKELLLHVNADAIQDETPVRDILSVLREHQKIAADHLEAATAHYVRYVASDEKSQAWREYEERTKCHQAFKTSSYEEFKNFNPDRDPNTCKWVLGHAKYLEWLTCENDTLLWISAHPGCGKSVLAKSLVEKELRSTSGYTTCHFFFKDNLEQERLSTALCAVLHQLFSSQPNLLKNAIPYWRKNGENMKEEVTALWDILLAASTDPEAHNITIILDALDECKDKDRERLLELLTMFYITASAKTPDSTRTNTLKFLVTSRPYSNIEDGFNDIPPHLPSIRLSGEKEDEQLGREINRVIDKKTLKLAKDLKLAPKISGRIRRQLLGMENRTYLWLQLVIGTIYQTYRNSLRPEEETFEVLPSSVESAYEKILNKVSEKSHDTVMKILLIIVGARRPLTVSEMAVALGVATAPPGVSLEEARLDSDRVALRLSDWSGLFVSISNGAIYLIHQTAREFLVNRTSRKATSQSWKHCLTEPEIENAMTKICVKYLELHDEFLANNPSITGLDVHNQHLRPQNPELEADLPWDSVSMYDGEEGDHARTLYNLYPEGDFFSYAIQFWQIHLEGSELRENEELMSRLLRLHDLRSSSMCKYIYWFGHPRDTIGFDESDDSNAAQWHAVIASGCNELLEWMLNQGDYESVNITDAKGNTPLLLASCFNRKAMVEILIRHGADVNFPCESFYESALEAACDFRHSEVEEILLANGANAAEDIYALPASMRGRENSSLADRLIMRRKDRRRSD